MIRRPGSDIYHLLSLKLTVKPPACANVLKTYVRGRRNETHTGGGPAKGKANDGMLQVREAARKSIHQLLGTGGIQLPVLAVLSSEWFVAMSTGTMKIIAVGALVFVAAFWVAVGFGVHWALS